MSYQKLSNNPTPDNAFEQSSQPPPGYGTDTVGDTSQVQQHPNTGSFNPNLVPGQTFQQVNQGQTQGNQNWQQPQSNNTQQPSEVTFRDIQGGGIQILVGDVRNSVNTLYAIVHQRGAQHTIPKSQFLNFPAYISNDLSAIRGFVSSQKIELVNNQVVFSNHSAQQPPIQSQPNQGGINIKNDNSANNSSNNSSTNNNNINVVVGGGMGSGPAPYGYCIDVMVMLFMNPCAGIAAIVFHCIANSNLEEGYVDSAKKNHKYAVWSRIAGVILGVITIIAVIAASVSYADHECRKYGLDDDC